MRASDQSAVRAQPARGRAPAGFMRALVARPSPEDVRSVVLASGPGALVTAVNALIFTFGLWNSLGGPLLGLWCAATVAACGLVALRTRRAARRQVSTVSRRGARRLMLFSVLLALPWGALALGVLGVGTAFEQLLVLMICAGMAAGGTFMLHRTLAAAVAFYGALLGAVLMACVINDLAALWPIAIYAAIYGGFLSWFAYLAGATARQRDGALDELSRTVSALRKAHDRITELAFVDSVTGLPNRKAFGERLAAACRVGTPFSLLMLDIDRFKNVNDTLGHAAGDEFLAALGRRLREALRRGDIVARLGGDEFAVLVIDMAEVEEISALGARLIETLAAPIGLGSRRLIPGCSIGAARFPAEAHDPRELMLRADIALHRAKEMGRGRFLLFDERLGEQVEEADWIEKELRAALETGALTIAYHPKIDLATGALHGAEALIRWTHPEAGIVAPDRFLPVAAERGLMPRLTAHVFDRVAGDMLDWRARGVPAGRIALNIHPVDLKTPDLLMTSLKAMIRRGIVTTDVILEITEGCFVGRGGDAAALVLDSMSELGFELSLDDFGTGHASLSHLRKLPVREIKIDRGFVEGLTRVAHDRAIVAATIEIARGMGLRSVAEGVETEAQVDLLSELGADIGQGYLWARPLPAAEFAAFARARASRCHRRADARGASGG